MKARPVHVVLTLVVLVATGCGGGRKASPEVTGTAREAATLVQRLGAATAARDYATICDALLTASERTEAGGSDCARLMAERAKGIRRPRIRIRRIELVRDGALVHVRTSAAGQAAVDDTIRLERERGRLRIAALGR